MTERFLKLTAPGLALAAVLLTFASGCNWMKGQLKGEEFQDWNKSIGGNLRSDSTKAEHSGFFFNSKAQQIEKNLGGGY